MLKWYGYVGILLIVFAELNFLFVVEPFALWYMSIVWIGYILFIDAMVYRVKGQSIISGYIKEFVFICILSVPFWLIFEFYNLFTKSWTYTNYTWYIQVAYFITIMPAVLETFSLISAAGIFKRFDSSMLKKSARPTSRFYFVILVLLVLFGFVITVLPFIMPQIGYPFMWVGLMLLLDPLNNLIGRPSVGQKVAAGKRSILYGLFLSGLIMGFFWEFWNFQAFPKWTYNISYLPFSYIKLFEMPIAGYLGYLPFAVEVYLYYALFRSFIFKNRNALLDM